MLSACRNVQSYCFNELSRGVLLVAIVTFLFADATANAATKPSAQELAAITERGRALAEYDSAVGLATSAVVSAGAKAESAARYIAHKTLAGWVVDFGRLNATGDKFLAAYEATQTSVPSRFEVRTFNPVREDNGWLVGLGQDLDNNPHT